MKKTFTRLMAAFLALILMMGTFPAEASAATNSDPKLPDPGKFLGCNRGENQDSRGTSWLYSYKMELTQDAVDAAAEYLDLLLKPEYKLKLVDATEDDYTNVAASIFYGFSFDYTGSKKVGYYEDTDGTRKGNLHVSLYVNYQENFLMLSFYFGDGFKVTDCGKHTTHKVKDLNRNSGSSYSGSSSGSGSSWKKGNTVQCGVCDGSGRCRKCGGDGYLYSSASKKENRNCTSCHTHRGRCGSCGGDGWLN